MDIRALNGADVDVASTRRANASSAARPASASATNARSVTLNVHRRLRLRWYVANWRHGRIPWFSRYLSRVIINATKKLLERTLDIGVVGKLQASLHLRG